MSNPFEFELMECLV